MDEHFSQYLFTNSIFTYVNCVFLPSGSLFCVKLRIINTALQTKSRRWSVFKMITEDFQSLSVLHTLSYDNFNKYKKKSSMCLALGVKSQNNWCLLSQRFSLSGWSTGLWQRSDFMGALRRSLCLRWRFGRRPKLVTPALDQGDGCNWRLCHGLSWLHLRRSGGRKSMELPCVRPTYMLYWF